MAGALTLALWFQFSICRANWQFLGKRIIFMKVTVRKKVVSDKIPVEITTEFIKLESAMKLCNAVGSGGAGKNFIQVLVNGEICTMRGKKLRHGDEFTFLGQTYLIQNAN